jgi:hypothetical protein
MAPARRFGAPAGGSGGTGGGTAGTAAGGMSGGGGSSGGAATCASQCMTSTFNAAWTDCNGCCCWLAAGMTTTHGSQICGADAPCCTGRGRTGTKVP